MRASLVSTPEPSVRAGVAAANALLATPTKISPRHIRPLRRPWRPPRLTAKPVRAKSRPVDSASIPQRNVQYSAKPVARKLTPVKTKARILLLRAEAVGSADKFLQSWKRNAKQPCMDKPGAVLLVVRDEAEWSGWPAPAAVLKAAPQAILALEPAR
jgi:hypothetical protein